MNYEKCDKFKSYEDTQVKVPVESFYEAELCECGGCFNGG